MKTVIEELKEVNLGTEEEPRKTFIASSMSEREETRLIDLLQEFRNIFAWSTNEMPGLSPDLVVHSLSVSPNYKPVKASPPPIIS